MMIRVINPGPTEAIIAQQLADGIYEGVDLTAQHAEEITQYSDPWSWVRARIKAKDYSGIHVGDYIPFTCTNQVGLSAEVAGINTYRGYIDTETPDHIDFISREIWPELHAMNKYRFNNGISMDVQSPWLASDLHHWINSMSGNVPGGAAVGGAPLEAVDYTAAGIWHFLPADLQAAITASRPKRILIPFRYSVSGLLTADVGWGSKTIGRLWIPSEVEVSGSAVFGSAGYGAGGFVQYPIFANNMKRVKRRNSSRESWWLLSAGSGSLSLFSLIAFTGDSACGHANADTVGVPVCFRLTAS